MKKFFILTVFLFLLSLSACSYQDNSNNIVTDEKTGITFANDELLISVKKGIDSIQLNNFLKDIKGKIVEEFITDEYLIKLDKAYTFSELKELQVRIKENYSDIIESVAKNIGITVLEE